MILVSRTLSGHWFTLVGTSGSYTSRKLWKLEKFWFICYWFDLRTTLESYALRENDKSSRKNSKYHFTDFYFFLIFWGFFLRPYFHFRTCIFSNAYFFRTIETRRKNKFGKKYKSKKRNLQVWKEFWSWKKTWKSQKNVSPWIIHNENQVGEERKVQRVK